MNPPNQKQITLAAILAIAVLGFSACNSVAKSNATPGGSNDPIAAHVGLSASSLNFGSVTVNTTKTMHLTLTNSTPSGGPSVTISQATAGGTGFSSSNTVPIELAAGQSVDLAVSFKPTTSGAATGTFTIDVLGATDPAMVPLQGSGTTTASAQLSLSPSTLAFGSVNVGSTKNLTGTITASNADVVVSSAAWNGTGYSVTGITFPTTVQSGKSASFTVTFAPQAAGSAPGNISFVSDATNSPAAGTFTGTGVAVGQQHTVSLSWSASTSTVAGYNVYRGGQSGGPYSKINSALQPATNYTDGSVQSGQTYFYVATAVDGNSAESAFSGEVAVVVPTP
jgi:ASPM-SPD-2-Hydin domain-containing protein